MRNLLFILRELYAFLVFPTSCICCDKKTSSVPLCASCRSKTVDKHQYVPRCRKCGIELISELELCTGCRNDEKRFENIIRIYPLFFYAGWAKEILYQWKIAGRRSLSAIFAQAVYRVLCEQFNSAAINDLESAELIPLVPVPPRNGKIRQKGWDQIEELACFLEKSHRYPVLRILERSESAEQKTLHREERKSNIQKALKIKSAAPIPKKVIILDDLITSGATVTACAHVLYQAGVEEIYAVSLFIA